MKALIIENDTELSVRANQFLKYNRHLFTDIRAELTVAERPYASIFPSILWADAILIDSQFNNKKQLQAFTQEFVRGHLKDKKYCFFIFDIKHFCNEWIKKGRNGLPYWKSYINKEIEWANFPDYDQFREDLIQLVTRCCIYDIIAQPHRRRTVYKCSPFPLGYDQTTDTFNFLENDIPAGCQLY